MEKIEDCSSLDSLVAALRKVGTCWSPSFSPEGTLLAFISDLSGIPGIWTVSSRGGWPMMVTSLDDPITQVIWSPDGKWLGFQLAPGGGMNTQLYVIRPDGTGLRRLSTGGNEGNHISFRSRDSQQLLFTSNGRSPSSMDACAVCVASGEMRILSNNERYGCMVDLSPDGRHGLFYRNNQRVDSDLFLVDIARGTEVCLTPHDGYAASRHAVFSPDGSVIYLATNIGAEMVGVGRISLDDEGSPEPLKMVFQRDDAEIECLAVSKHGVAGVVWNAYGLSELSLIELESERVVASPKLPIEVIFQLCFSSDGHLLALSGQGPAVLQNIFLCDMRAGFLCSQIMHSHHPGIDPAHLLRPELVHFQAHDGLKLSGWLYVPSNFGAPGPLVIGFHGGPECQSRPFFGESVQGLLARGIAVLTPNVRGSSGFGKTFVNLDNGAQRFNAIKDIKACAEYAIASGVGAGRELASWTVPTEGT